MNAQLPMPVTAPFSRAQRAALLNLVARAANTEILPRFGKLDAGMVRTKSGPSDLVTDADTAAEAMITRGLQIAFPNAVIVGEEAVSDDRDFRKTLAEAELGFLIDPVDGTWNFAHGLPVFGTIIAATRFGRPVFGLIHDTVGQDVYWADIDTPATWVPRNGRSRRLTTRKDTALTGMSGYIEVGHMDQAHQKAAALACLDLESTTTLRCSAHHYRLLAQGAVDFVMASKLNPWDHAAGVLLCRQAGGHAAFLDGTPYDTSVTEGYLLCAGSVESWNVLADHFHAIV